MALDLSMTYVQSNDATYLTLTDTTGDYDAVDNDSGWGAPNEDYADIVVSTDTTTASSYHLLLDVTVLDSTNTSTSYDTINLYDLNGGAFAAASDLTWTITPAILISGGDAMGEVTDRLVDGLYTIKYYLVDNDDHTSVVDSLQQDVLIDGDVRADVYSALREIGRQYDDEVNDESREIMEALLKYSYLLGINAATTVSNRDDIIHMLYTLKKLNRDGSRYTW